MARCQPTVMVRSPSRGKEIKAMANCLFGQGKKKKRNVDNMTGPVDR